MERICPVCNKLYNISIRCSKCGNLMAEKGRDDEYLDDYTANMPLENSTCCTHIFYCYKCDKMEKICINNEFM
ncbi:hypothetical protein SAMN05444401_1240 [Clostridium amylolyticum]|uniref:Uncharacterized protein n=1 Tax=Clostridium amylolyticum TaxID=1121298 RepID=A0A1M6CUV5_9CLOT|nr:hypothetical protein [Clostridium amylolyticum]SHI64621.1 hypothetical protein SAMN05444401_1240 [Clostridium amylolyticum]